MTEQTFDPTEGFDSLGFSQLAGGQHHQLKEAIDGGLKAGDLLTMTREPHNEYDSNAIKLNTELGIPVGYIKKSKAKELAPLMDSGRRAFARISHLHTDHSRPGAVLEIWLKQEAPSGT